MTSNAMKTLLAVLCVVSWLAFPAVVAVQTPAQSLDGAMSAAFRKQFTDYVVANHRTPEDFVADQFKDHDIVFIGESHDLKQNREFVYSLMKRLSERGVYNLVLEFAWHEDQAKIDRLVTGATFDEKLAGEITYGPRSYAGAFRVAWQINHDRPSGSRPFRVVAFNQKDGRAELPSSMPLAEKDRIADTFLGGHRKDMMNRSYADVLVKEVIARNEKAVVYCGSGHAGTKFRLNRLPLTPHFTSFGNFIYNYIRERTMTVLMHGALAIQIENGGANLAPDTAEARVLSVVEALMDAVPARFQRAGLATANAPLGQVPLPGALGYREGRSSDFTMADYCDGYIYLVKRSELTKEPGGWR